MSTATIEQNNPSDPVCEDERNTPLPLRSDTILGVCEAVGQDLGVHPNWLRVPFAALILWNPEVIIACYLGLGAVVALTRWLLPARNSVSAPQAVPAAEQPASSAAEAEQEKELLAA